MASKLIPKYHIAKSTEQQSNKLRKSRDLTSKDSDLTNVIVITKAIQTRKASRHYNHSRHKGNAAHYHD